VPDANDQTVCAVGMMLTEAQIALLRDVGMASKFSAEKKTEVLKLITQGYIERDGDLFRLTATGLRALLTKRA
jgi:hypothetical protein